MRKARLSLFWGALLTVTAVGAPRAQEFAAECAAADSPVTLTIGAADCRRIESAYMGGTTAFGYYIPPACDPAEHPGVRCPVMYFHHGTGGDEGMCNAFPGSADRVPCYFELLGPKGSTVSPMIKALTHRPPVDVRQVLDPWNYGPDTWVPAESALEMILVVPYNFTVPGGYGPDGPRAPAGWSDWNPRYALGGDQQKYPTPPPQVENHILHELIPLVDAHFPTVGDRQWRAISGISQGGLGSSLMFFRNPDVYASVGMFSGASIPGPWTQAYHLDGLEPDALADVASMLPPLPVPYRGPLPPVVGDAALAALQASTASGLVIVGPEAFYLIVWGQGDPIADSAYVRAHNPGPHLAANARAWAGTKQSSHIIYSSGDAIPRLAEDPESEFGGAEGEAIIVAGNVQLEEAMHRFGIEREFFFRPGLHGFVYWLPFVRYQWERQHARLKHADGSGDPPPYPTRFDYRAIETDFTIWDWRFEIADRAPTEFLYLTNVTCDSLTLRGTGRVTVHSPARCGPGHPSVFTVDLGPEHATDEPVIGASKAYGRTVTVAPPGQ